MSAHTGQYQSAYSQALAAALGDDWQARMEREVRRRGVEPAAVDAGGAVGYQTNGFLGQYLVLLPAAGIVAVRLIRRSPDYDAATDGFDGFIDRVRALVPEGTGA